MFRVPGSGVKRFYGVHFSRGGVLGMFWEVSSSRGGGLWNPAKGLRPLDPRPRGRGYPSPWTPSRADRRRSTRSKSAETERRPICSSIAGPRVWPAPPWRLRSVGSVTGFIGRRNQSFGRRKLRPGGVPPPGPPDQGTFRPLDPLTRRLPPPLDPQSSRPVTPDQQN